MKQQPPQYPRPVPELDLDEAPILPGTIVCEEHCCDTENARDDSEQSRAAKRRRIETAANAYLRGEQLFILSAGLKGPFGGDWQNPWTKNRTCDPRRTGADRIKSTNKNLNGNESAVVPGGNQPLLQPKGSLRLCRDSDRKVKAWLRKDDKCTSQKSFDDKSSHTPSNGNLTHFNAGPNLSEYAQFEDSVSSLPVEFAEGREHFGTVGAAAIAHSRLQDMLKHEKRPVHRATDATDRRVSAQDSLIDGTQARRTSNTEGRDLGANHTALTAKGKESTESDEDNAKPQESYRSQAHEIELITRITPDDRQQSAASKHKPPNIEARSEQQVPQNGNHISGKGDIAPLFIKEDRPVSSTFTSEGGLLELPPSAQKQPGLPTSASILMEEKLIIPPSSYAHATNDAVMDNNLSLLTSSKALNDAGKWSRSEVSLGHNQGSTSQKTTLGLTEEGNTADAHRHDRSNSSTNDIPYVADKPIQSAALPAAPCSAMNPPSHKTQKRASFVLDTGTERTHNSIKSVLKVGKSTTSATKEGSNLLNSEKRDSHVVTSDTENRNCNGFTSTKVARLSLDGIRAGNDNKPNGILKSSMRTSPRTVDANDFQHTSKVIARSSILLHDAQTPERVPMVIGENDANLITDVNDSFDLNNAIDDLGSFLCTWDTEKDASMMPSLT